MTDSAALSAHPPTAVAAPERFVRDRATWFGYFAFTYCFFIISGYGPAMPFIRERLGLSYTVAGLHFTAVSLGMVIGGVIGDRIVRRMGRQRTAWIMLALVTQGPIVLLVSPTMFITMPAMMLSGFASMTQAIAIQSDITERHGRFRAKPLVEVNLAASSGAILASLLVGAFGSTRIGWIGAYLLIYIFGIAAAWSLRSVRILEGAPIAHGAAASRLPGRFWILASINALSAATEWSVGYWGTDFLHESTGIATSTAAALLSTFFLAMVLGRLTGSRINQKFHPLRLLAASFALASVGFVIFWMSNTISLTIIGLILFGLGTANVYPACATYATSMVPTRPDAAFARLMLVSSCAILLAPQLLGVLGDQIGIASAFSVGIPLTVIALGLSGLLIQVDRRATSTSLS